MSGKRRALRATRDSAAATGKASLAITNQQHPRQRHFQRQRQQQSRKRLPEQHLPSDVYPSPHRRRSGSLSDVRSTASCDLAMAHAATPIPETRTSPLTSPSPTEENDSRATTTLVEDQLTFMFRMEGRYTMAAAAASASPLPLGAPPVPQVANPMVPREEWRSKICDWSYRVIDHFRYDREVVSVSMNYFDRYLVALKARREAEAAAEAAAKASQDEQPVQDWTEVLPPRSVKSAKSLGTCSMASGYRDPQDSALDESDCEDQQEGREDHGNDETAAAAAAAEISIDSQTYQLAAMTSLYLSIKLHAEPGADDDRDPFDSHGPLPGASVSVSRPGRPCRRRLKLQSFVKLSRGQFHPEDITEMERGILEALGWRVNPPTVMAFVNYLLRLLPVALPNPTGDVPPKRARRNYDLVLHILHELSRYLAELSLCLSDVCVLHPPSAVAYATVLVSIDMLNEEALPQYVRDAFVQRVALLSSLGRGRGAKLDAKDETLYYLKGRIRVSFLPEMMLNASTYSTQGIVLDDEGNGDSGNGLQDDMLPLTMVHQSHPLVLAWEAGLLDLEKANGYDATGNDGDVNGEPQGQKAQNISQVVSESDEGTDEKDGEPATRQHQRSHSTTSLMDNIHSPDRTAIKKRSTTFVSPVSVSLTKSSEQQR